MLGGPLRHGRRRAVLMRLVDEQETRFHRADEDEQDERQGDGELDEHLAASHSRGRPCERRFPEGEEPASRWRRTRTSTGPREHGSTVDCHHTPMVDAYTTSVKEEVP